jgi:hypothetical protein
MDIESTLTLIFGTGIVTSLITVAATYFLDLKRKEKDREIEKTDNLIGQVYSPLMIYFFEIIDFLGNSIYNLNAYSKSGSSEQEIRFLKKGLGQTLQFFQSDSLRELLINRIGFVKPTKFGGELLAYFIIFRHYERKVAAYTSGKLLINDKEAEKKFLGNLLEAAEEIRKLTHSFAKFIDNLIDEKNFEMEKSQSVGVFSPTDFDRIMQLLQVD